MKSVRLAWLSVLLFLPSLSFGLTLAEAETEVRRLVRDTSSISNLQRYSDTIIDSFLNQAQRDVVSATWCLQESTGVTLVAGTTFYQLPSDLLTVKMVRFREGSGRIRKLNQRSYKALIESFPDWERTTGPPMEYVLRYSTQSATTHEIAYLPIPTSASTGTAIVDYYEQATDMSSDSDVLLDGVAILIPHHMAVVYGAVLKIKMIEGDTAGVTMYAQLVQGAIAALKSQLGSMPDYAPGLSASP